MWLFLCWLFMSHRWKFGVAFASAAVEDLPALGQKFPHIPMLLQFQFQDTKAAGVSYHAIPLPEPEAFQISTPGPDYKLNNSARWIGDALRILRRETFIMMRMTV